MFTFRFILAFMSVVFVICCLMTTSEACNEAVCASIVSKCMITQSCKCELKDCSCCKECFSCLGHLYTECCSCVNLCPKPNNTDSSLSSKSHIEDLQESHPNLFQALNSEPDPKLRWETYNFPVDVDISRQSHLLKPIHYWTDVDQEIDRKDDMVITLNCSVAFLSKCMPWNKCKLSCQSMGAVSYRWFHNGCCECVGHNCINYGINETRCRKCNEEINESELDNSMDADYGVDD